MIAVVSALSVIVVALTLPARSQGRGRSGWLRCGCRPGNCCIRRSGSPISPSRSLVGQLAFGTFQVAILTEVTGLEPLVMVPIYLLIGGARRRDRHLARRARADWNDALAIMIVIVGQIVCFALLLFVSANAVAMAIALFLGSAFGFGFSTPIQVRILHGAREALASPQRSCRLPTMSASRPEPRWAPPCSTAGAGYALLPADRHRHAARWRSALAATSLTLSRRGIA